MASAVVGVVGGSGGAGTSTFAAALAAASGAGFLIDVDPLGGGVDVLLGAEAVPGARWSGLQVAGGRLDPAALEAGLPRWGDVRVLGADVSPSAEAVIQATRAAAELGPVILDLARAPGEARDAALQMCDLVVVVVLGSVTGVAGARRVISSLPAVSAGVVLRRGSIGRRDAARLLGVPVLCSLPETVRGGVHSPGKPVPAALVRVAGALLAGLLTERP